MRIVIQGDMLVPGEAEGLVLSSDEPISLWGGLDPTNGEIIDRRHPLSGQIVTDRILSIPFGRGSCSASGVLLESVALGTGPAGIIVSKPDPILGLGAVLADELLVRPVPVVLITEAERVSLGTDLRISIESGGRIVAQPPDGL